MGSVNMPAGLVKKETLLIGVLVALAVGFVGGVIYSSFKAPQVAAVSPAQPASPAVAQTQTGPNPEQVAKISSLELEVGRDSSNVSAWTQLGNLYFDTDQAAKAIVAYNKALNLNQALPDVWTDLGVMYRHTRQFKEAVAAFDKAISINPALEQAYFNKGIVLIYDLGDKTGGRQAWQQVVALNPNAHTPNGQLVKDLLNSLK
ncbi:MAG: tetratricopeptide repeat protein [Desulfobulbaceae bacterium]|nr:tetratricopeptide repeat protein [Desulfobulbaceae bacterium]